MPRAYGLVLFLLLCRLFRIDQVNLHRALTLLALTDFFRNEVAGRERAYDFESAISTDNVA